MKTGYLHLSQIIFLKVLVFACSFVEAHVHFLYVYCVRKLSASP